MIYKIKDIPIKCISDLYEYDEKSPSCLSWKVDIESKITPGYIIAKKGSRSGTLNSCNRWQISFNKIIYSVHRVIWTMFNGPIPDGRYINHINCNPSDNRIENLELATPQQNSRKANVHVNHTLSKLNTSGVNGVYEEKTWNGGRTKINYYARAYWHNQDGVAVRKSFAYSKYGKELAWKLAEDHVKTERVKVDVIVDERDEI